MCLCVCVLFFSSFEIFVALRQVVRRRQEKKTTKKKKLELEIISKVQNRILGRIEIAINPEDDPN